MNYYEHHLGDYAEATGHLTFVEDAAYSRLIRKYYSTEKPLPAEIKSVQRLVGAQKKDEKEAVETVLKEFFELRADGWHQDRCDIEIARYQAGEPEREVKKANEDNRMKRHREERARLLKLVTDAGLHAPWNIGITELRNLAARLDSDGKPETENVPLPETAPATPATATQTPDTRHQTPVLKTKAEDSGGSTAYDHPTGAPLPPREDPQPSDNPAIAMSVALRKLGVNALFTHPAVQDWTAKAVPFEILAAAVAKARESKGAATIPPNYLVGIVNELLNPPTAAQPRASPVHRTEKFDPVAHVNRNRKQP